MNLYIPAVCISLLGSTQPGKISEYVRHAVNGSSNDDGLIQRFGLMIWPDVPSKWKDVDQLPNEEAKKKAYQVFDQLNMLDAQSVKAEQEIDSNGQPVDIPYLRFSQDGLELFKEWREGLEARLRSGDLHPALESHFSKYRKLVPSLALILHLANGDTGSVSKQATEKALLWEEYLETHANRIYQSATQPEVEAAKAILKHIRNNDISSEFSARDIYRKGWAHLSKREQAEAGIQMLIDYDWLQEKQKANTGGRDATVYMTNPAATE